MHARKQFLAALLIALCTIAWSTTAAEPRLEKIDLFEAGVDGYALYRIPCLTVTSRGTVLAWCEARLTGKGDWGPIDIMLRRSTDGGKTWSARRKVSDVPGPKTKNPVALAQKLASPDDVTYNNPVAIADRDGAVHFLYCLEYARAFYTRSDDDGLTWSQPVEITGTFDAFRPEYDWKVLATGPGHGIQLQNGRLVVPVWLSLGTGGHAHRPSVTAVIFSDDGGKTWQRGQIAVPDTSDWVFPNETTAIELADGRVLLNVRTESKSHRRVVVTSADGATNWSTPRFDEALVEPICMASTVRLSRQSAGGKNRILFANPDNLERADGKAKPGGSRDRRNLSIKLSYDEGQTWPVSRSLEPGYSAYSDLAVLPDGTILCFYERGRAGADKQPTSYAGLTLARFNLEWLTDGQDTRKAQAADDSSPLSEKARWFQDDLVERHWLDGLYVSIVPSPRPGQRLMHTVDEPGNVIHAGVWTGRYLAGVGYQYALTRDPAVREHGGQILKALRILQEVTGKPGLLARGYVKGHGPVMDWERDGADSREWHQGQGAYANYRWYGDVSVDNFNAVLYGYAIYYDLAADDQQKQMIAHDTDRLMTHLLENHCRIIDVDGEPTQFGHVGIDPDPARDAYYDELYAARRRLYGVTETGKLPLRASLMLLPDLLIAHHVTGKQHYLDFYRRVVERFKNNEESGIYSQGTTAERMARANHSSEGQAFEAMYNLVRYERDPALLEKYRRWVADLWELNWTEGNSLFTYMTLALLPEYRAPDKIGEPATVRAETPHGAESLRLANETLVRFPIDRMLRPVMNSRRTDIEIRPLADRARQPQAVKPLPVNERPHDNEYEWKGNPYRLDGWLKPTLAAMQFACDDPQIAWCVDSAGRVWRTLDHGSTWAEMNGGLMGNSVRNLVASDKRTFVLWAETADGVLVTRDGGLSWRRAGDDKPTFNTPNFGEWAKVSESVWLRVDPQGQLQLSNDGGQSSKPAMQGWRIAEAKSVFATPWGAIASGPGGTYRSADGENWSELSIWPELETGAADFLHAYWMGRYYGLVPVDDNGT
jgi:sialidase-1